jgi:GNAT superfamily N-acetyltransferase
MSEPAALVIRAGQLEDADLLPSIERSAGAAFRSIPALSWIAGDGVLSEEEHRRFAGSGTSWVAEDEGGPVGFLVAERVPPALHIWEIAVRLDRQGRGLGTRLIETAIKGAREEGLSEMTLTTFRDVPWNEPFYQRLGFVSLGDGDIGDRLAAILSNEAERGLPADRRVAMRLTL